MTAEELHRQQDHQHDEPHGRARGERIAQRLIEAVPAPEQIDAQRRQQEQQQIRHPVVFVHIAKHGAQRSLGIVAGILLLARVLAVVDVFAVFVVIAVLVGVFAVVSGIAVVIGIAIIVRVAVVGIAILVGVPVVIRIAVVGVAIFVGIAVVVRVILLRVAIVRLLIGGVLIVGVGVVHIGVVFALVAGEAAAVRAFARVLRGLFRVIGIAGIVLRAVALLLVGIVIFGLAALFAQTKATDLAVSPAEFDSAVLNPEFELSELVRRHIAPPPLSARLFALLYRAHVYL